MLQKVCRSRIGAALTAVLVAVVTAFFAFAQNSNPSSTSDEASWEAKVRSFLQKRYKIPQGSSIKFGPAQPTGFAGLISRTVTVTNDQGTVAKVTLFTDSKGSKIILGQLLNLEEDPWGKVDTDGISLNDRPTLGPSQAPVTIIEFVDFECPFCARAFGMIESLVRNRYPGQVKLVFKNFPLRNHPWARGAAIAARCVYVQNPDAFWTFANDLYAAQPQINVDNLRGYIDQFAKELRLDLQALNACMMSAEPEKVIKQDIADGVKVNVNSTPTLLVNGVPVVGVPDEKTLDFVVTSQLKAKTAGTH